MRFVVPVVLAMCGCSHMSLRAGGVFVGDRPAFQATVEMGISINRTHRAVQASSEFGVQTAGHAQFVDAVNLDVVEIDPGEGPLARIGPRVRSAMLDHDKSSSAFEVRGAFYSGPLREAKTGSGGLGVEIAGGVQVTPTIQPIFEASLVVSGKWKVD